MTRFARSIAPFVNTRPCSPIFISPSVQTLIYVIKLINYPSYGHTDKRQRNIWRDKKAPEIASGVDKKSQKP